MDIELNCNHLVIYYDESDDSQDGNGWNLIPAPGSMAYRFPTLEALLHGISSDATWMTIWLQKPVSV